MKIRWLMMLVLQLVSLSSIAQELENNIKYIRAQFVAVNNLCKEIDPITLEANEESSEGGEIMGYKIDGRLIKAQTAYYGEMGKFTTDYYYNELGLFFVFTQSYDYNAPIYDSESFDLAKSVIIENRYYFKGEKLIKWLDKEKKSVSSAHFKEKQEDVLSESFLVLSKFN